MTPGTEHIRRAQPNEAEALRELAHRSKAHWPYDAAFLEAVRPLLQLSAEDIERDDVFVLVRDDEPIGWYRLAYGADGTAELEDLWVDSPQIGTGRGRRLWEHAVATAAERGARHVEWDADPFAQPFYERMGGRRIGDTPSTAFPGRLLPRMRFDLP